MRVIGQIEIEVSRIDLTHKRLGPAYYAHGGATIFGEPALLVITEEGSGGKLTIRPQPAKESEAVEESAGPPLEA